MAMLPPGLIWLASYPKSGNTWLRILFANLLAGGDQPRHINNLTEEETLLSRWRFGDDVLAEPDTLYPSELASLRAVQGAFVARSLRSAFVCKTHDSFDPEIAGSFAKAALYIIRDPRDVAISLSHHAGITIDCAITRMLDPACQSEGVMQLRYKMGDWASHVAGWTTQTGIPLEVVRYEDLREDPVKEFTRIFAGLAGLASPAEIARAVGHSSLEELQRQESTAGFREKSPGQLRFFRTGQIGEWRNLLTTAQVRKIESACAPVMERWGYATLRPA